jgi:ASC-1-like (ASCH) protein
MNNRFYAPSNLNYNRPSNMNYNASPEYQSSEDINSVVINLLKENKKTQDLIVELLMDKKEKDYSTPEFKKNPNLHLEGMLIELESNIDNSHREFKKHISQLLNTLEFERDNKKKSIMCVYFINATKENYHNVIKKLNAYLSQIEKFENPKNPIHKFNEKNSSVHDMVKNTYCVSHKKNEANFGEISSYDDVLNAELKEALGDLKKRELNKMFQYEERNRLEKERMKANPNMKANLMSDLDNPNLISAINNIIKNKHQYGLCKCVKGETCSDGAKLSKPATVNPSTATNSSTINSSAVNPVSAFLRENNPENDSEYENLWKRRSEAHKTLEGKIEIERTRLEREDNLWSGPNAPNIVETDTVKSTEPEKIDKLAKPTETDEKSLEINPLLRLTPEKREQKTFEFFLKAKQNVLMKHGDSFANDPSFDDAVNEETNQLLDEWMEKHYFS